MSTNYDIYEIIVRSFSNQLNEEEKVFLVAWKAESKTNLAEYLDYEAIWQESGKLKTTKAVDAAIALAGTRKLAGIRKKRNYTTWLNVAAVVLLSLTFTGLYEFFNRQQPALIQENPVIAMQDVKATFGTQTRVNLPDGSVVHLNSGSTLRFPVSFSGADERKVSLSGEGYFNVAGDADQPFVVDAGKLHVQAVGTSFNVDAYPGNKNITIALTEGVVNLLQQTSRGATELVAMKPGETATLLGSENRLVLDSHENLYKYYAWTEGKIVFANDPIQVVVEKLANWYNVDIVIADSKLERYRFTGTFIDEPLDQILAILSRTSPMGYSIQSAKKLDDNSFTRRKIILKSKQL